MANSFGQFTGWVSVSHISKSQSNCTSHKPMASFQRWQVGGDLVHGICPHAASQSYVVYISTNLLLKQLVFMVIHSIKALEPTCWNCSCRCCCGRCRETIVHPCCCHVSLKVAPTLQTFNQVPFHTSIYDQPFAAALSVVKSIKCFPPLPPVPIGIISISIFTISTIWVALSKRRVVSKAKLM